MAYNFLATTSNILDAKTLGTRLSEADLVEFFLVERSPDVLSMGLSIPFKHMDDHRFEQQLAPLMTYLIVEHDFEVFDLYKGQAVLAENIGDLARQISG